LDAHTASEFLLRRTEFWLRRIIFASKTAVRRKGKVESLRVCDQESLDAVIRIDSRLPRTALNNVARNNRAGKPFSRDRWIPVASLSGDGLFCVSLLQIQESQPGCASLEQCMLKQLGFLG
jgi:hypothetical protein